MQTTTSLVSVHKLDTDELFNVETSSSYAGVPITIQVHFIETTARNGLAPSTVLVSGYKVGKSGEATQVWTERRFSTFDETEAAELATFPAAIREAIGI